MTNRRDFIERVGAAAMLSALPGDRLVPPNSREEHADASPWDMSWVDKLEGAKHKAVFDCTEIERGGGPERAGVWVEEYLSILKVRPKKIRAVVVLRYIGIVLALRQDLWEKFEIGKTEKVLSPLGPEVTDWNPALAPGDRGDRRGSASDSGLTGFIARGGIVLACNLALQRYTRLFKRRDGVDDDEAQRRAVGGLIPGVVLQPSGVFAVVRAGEAGCVYVKAS